jgi:HSP20 family protein
MVEKGESEATSLSRWDPFRDLATSSPLSRLIGDLFGERLIGEWPRLAGHVAPPVDITESEDHYLVSAEVPGAKREDISLEIHERVLTIRGEKRNEREETREQGRYLERTYGAFSRSFTLPSDADADRISAVFEDGVLKVTVPKRPEAKPRTVAIKS